MFFFNGRRDRDPNVQIFFPFSDLMSLSNSCRWYFGRCFLGWQKDHRLFPSVRSSSFYCIHLQWYPSSISFFSFFFLDWKILLFFLHVHRWRLPPSARLFFSSCIYIYFYIILFYCRTLKRRETSGRTRRERERETKKIKTRRDSNRSARVFIFIII